MSLAKPFLAAIQYFLIVCTYHCLMHFLCAIHSASLHYIIPIIYKHTNPKPAVYRKVYDIMYLKSFLDKCLGIFRKPGLIHNDFCFLPTATCYSGYLVVAWQAIQFNLNFSICIAFYLFYSFTQNICYDNIYWFAQSRGYIYCKHTICGVWVNRKLISTCLAGCCYLSCCLKFHYHRVANSCISIGKVGHTKVIKC